MTKHDRLISALKEIKSICSKNEDYELGCGRKCPFLIGNEGDNFRPCEVMRFVQPTEVVDTPQEWGVEEYGE